MRKQLNVCGAILGLFFIVQSKAYAADANQGKEMYMQYCSSCHGPDGKGSGSVSAFLKVKVPDLTLLKKNNKGIYPLDQVILAIDGRRKLRSHGDPKMPVWGESFSSGSQRPQIRRSDRKPKGKSYCRICRHAPAVTLQRNVSC